MKDLKKLFYPESIAIVGATESKLKWGSFVTTNILDGGFKGPVYPIAQGRETVYGIKAYRTVSDVPGKIDLVYIATPASTVMGILRECVEKDIHNVVIISSGFSEVGGEGKKIEDEMADFAVKNGINVVGPNTMGMSNLNWFLHGTGAHPRPKPGGISIIAQSGNVGNQIMLWAELEGFGINKFVGSGNEAVLKVEDYLAYFNDDDDTTVILMYLEGVDDGRKFLDIAKNASLKKPVIALKAGRTAGGSRAAASHTGAMAGSFQIFESVMRQTGIMMAMNPTELLELSAAFDCYPLPKGNRVGIVTLGGGWGVITADECEERGLVLPPLPDEIRSKLDKKLPPFWSRANPVDMVGQPDVELFKETVELMVSSDAFDAIIVLGLVGASRFGIRPMQAANRLGYIPDEEIRTIEAGSSFFEKLFLDAILTMMNKYEKPIYPVSLASFPNDDIMYTKEGSRYKIIVYKTPEMAVLCLSKQQLYSKYLRLRWDE
ncbi:MAG: CoA-binding protein [Spirochaetes bacterium]|nr:CoA-binding protein [Spirochaetota bacterium]